MSHVISTHRSDDLRQIAVSDLSKVILCLVAPRSEHSALVVRVKNAEELANQISKNEAFDHYSDAVC